MKPKRGACLWSFCGSWGLAILLSTSPMPTYAQSQAGAGQIAGAVLDSSGAALPGATVKASNKQTGLERTATTSSDGLYRIVLLPPGTYSVSAEARGFAKATLEGLEVLVGETTDANLTLGVGAVRQEVVVTASTVGVKR